MCGNIKILANNYKVQMILNACRNGFCELKKYYRLPLSAFMGNACRMSKLEKDVVVLVINLSQSETIFLPIYWYIRLLFLFLLLLKIFTIQLLEVCKIFPYITTYFECKKDTQQKSLPSITTNVTQFAHLNF